MTQHYIVATDGGWNLESDTGGIAYIIQTWNNKTMLEERTYCGKLEKGRSNNQAELLAIRAALLAIPLFTPGDEDDPIPAITLYTDSQNSLGWLSMGWKINEAAIRSLVENITFVIDHYRLDVAFRKVKGHVSEQNAGPIERLNIRVDKMIRRLMTVDG